MVLLRYCGIKISPFRWLPYPLKLLEHITISQSDPLFSFFKNLLPSQKLLTITNLGSVGTNKNIENMDLCDFDQDTLSTSAPPPPPPPPSLKKKIQEQLWNYRLSSHKDLERSLYASLSKYPAYSNTFIEYILFHIFDSVFTMYIC